MHHSRRRGLACIGAVLVLAMLGVARTEAGAGLVPGSRAAAARPNILVVMTDDQDLASVAYMRRVRSLLGDRGVTFRGHTVEYSLCCPSRATYLSGQLSHNNNVRGQIAPAGGYGNLDASETLPVWLQRAGYATQHVGKYPNGYGMESHPFTLGVPPGWTDWRTPVGGAAGGADGNVYEFYGYTLNENGMLKSYGDLPREYRDDVETDLADAFIRQQVAAGKPFFADLSYLAPHWEWVQAQDVPDANLEALLDGSVEAIMNPPNHAPRHGGLFDGVKAPRDASYDEADVSDKPTFVQKRPRLSADQQERLDTWYRARLRSLQAVDEGVGRLVRTLKELDQLDNTYIIFTADNGWLQGQHRLTFGKLHVYEPSTRIPLIITGPGVAKGAIVDDWTANVDIPATIVALTGAQPGLSLDGMSLVPYLRRPSTDIGRVVLHNTSPDDAGYAAVRADRWKYVEYATGERELYDLRIDPLELSNAVTRPELESVVRRMRGYIDALMACEGSDCIVATRQGTRDAGSLP